MSGEPLSGPGGGDQIRASDEDREKLSTELREHAVAGRLTTDELEERLTATYAARTLAELSALRRDLPTSNPITAIGDAARRRHLARRVIQETGGSLGLFVVCTVIWLSSGATGQFWPIWVLLIFVLSLFRNGWALFGPAPDLDEVERNLDARRQKRLQKLEDRHGRRDRRRGGDSSDPGR
jgi:hypothetical protein